MKLQAIAILTFLTFANVMAQETTTTKYINSTECLRGEIGFKILAKYGRNFLHSCL